MHSYLQKSLPKILPGVCRMGFYVKENKGGTRKPIFKELWLNTFIIKKFNFKKILADSENFASFKNTMHVYQQNTENCIELLKVRNFPLRDGMVSLSVLD